MEEKDIKTSPKQRFFIILIAILMVGSIVASYAAIVVSGASSSNTNSTSQIDEAKVAEYKEAYEKEVAKFSDATKGDFDKFIKYKSKITAYNEAEANTSGVDVEDLKKGSGAKLAEDNYLAYYVGWCADETIFDSSFDNNDEPTAFAKILDPELGMIEGWTAGVEGMKLGGIREITIPSELAYKEQDIACGVNKPLKFLVMAVEKTDELAELSDELDTAFMRYQYYAQYGLDYDSLVKSETE